MAAERANVSLMNLFIYDDRNNFKAGFYNVILFDSFIA
jgi:hypothetical protein